MDAATPITMPALTGLDAITQALAALTYITIAAAALLRAPQDIRTRVFFVFSLANVAAFTIPALMWWKGIKDPSTAPRLATALVVGGLGVAALLLFHFTQVFPRRRPWILTSGVQMLIGYVLIPVVTVGLVMFSPASMTDVRPAYLLGLLIFGFPLLVLLAVVLPVTAIVSLVRSYRESEQPDLQRARVPLATILVSQIAGGAMVLVFSPVLTLLAPHSLALSLLTLLMWAVGLLTPLAFALAVWKYDVLSIDVE